MPKFHLARQVTSLLDTTRHVRRVEPMHFGCAELVEQRGSTRSSRRARHVERVVSWRDVTLRAKWNLGIAAGPQLSVPIQLPLSFRPKIQQAQCLIRIITN